jgi:sulfopropanediol 3-dehydrogenase
MSINYLKKAAKTPETETSTAQEVVTEMLSNIEKHGESAVKEYALKLDKWSGDIVMSDQAINAALADVPGAVKKDIDFAVKQVYDFAIAQKNSITDFSTTLHAGVSAGQKV